MCWPTYMHPCRKHASQRPFNIAALNACQPTYMITPWGYMRALIVPADIYAYVLQAVQLTGWEYIRAPIVPADTHHLLISPGPDQVTLMIVMHCGGGVLHSNCSG